MIVHHTFKSCEFGDNEHTRKSSWVGYDVTLVSFWQGHSPVMAKGCHPAKWRQGQGTRGGGGHSQQSCASPSCPSLTQSAAVYQNWNNLFEFFFLTCVFALKSHETSRNISKTYNFWGLCPLHPHRGFGIKSIEIKFPSLSLTCV